MKKIVSLVLLLALAVFCFAACSGAKEYTLTVAVDNVVEGNTATNVAVALLLDANGKIVDVRFDTVDAKLELVDGALKTSSDYITSKVELGDNYPEMNSGTWAEQAVALEQYVIGKTKADIESVDDNTVIAGCTMPNSRPAMLRALEKALDYGHKKSFTSSVVPTLGLALGVKISGDIDNGAKVSGDYAAVALADGKVVAAALDSNENGFTLAVDGETLTATAGNYAGTKNERGEEYSMDAGAWYKQAQAFADSAIGKTVAELADLELVSDALAEAGCTMQNTTGGYRAVIVKAAGAAR